MILSSICSQLFTLNLNFLMVEAIISVSLNFLTVPNAELSQSQY